MRGERPAAPRRAGKRAPEQGKRARRGLERLEEDLLVVALGVMTVVTFANVLDRKFLHIGLAFAEELTVSLFVWASLLGAAVAARRGAHLGLSRLWFGSMMTLNLAIGQITPPVAVNLLVAASIARVGLAEASRWVWPYLAAALVVLLLVTRFPELSVWLPRLLLGAR